MKTLILSSSLSPHSRSRVLCRGVEEHLIAAGHEVTFLDASTLQLAPFHRAETGDMRMIQQACADADNIVIGCGVHCYTINDSLKMILDTCFHGVTGKFFGVVCASGGEKSYLATTHLSQICMNEWRMIQLPRILFASAKDFLEDGTINNEEIHDRVKLFASEFSEIGVKLLR